MDVAVYIWFVQNFRKLSSKVQLLHILFWLKCVGNSNKISHQYGKAHVLAPQYVLGKKAIVHSRFNKNINLKIIFQWDSFKDNQSNYFLKERPEKSENNFNYFKIKFTIFSLKIETLNFKTKMSVHNKNVGLLLFFC